MATARKAAPKSARTPYDGFDRMPVGGAWRHGRGKPLEDRDPYTDDVLAESRTMTPLVPPSHPLSVLVVDDSRDAADSLGDLLSLYGYQTRVACGGEGALRRAAAEPPDVVVLDLAMPGMDGWELARRLRDMSGWRRPLLIAVSGYGDGAARRRSDDAGLDLHLVKPVEPAVIVGVLRRFARVLRADGPDLCRSRVTADESCTRGGRPVRPTSSG